MLGMIDQVACPTLFHFGNADAYIPNEGVDAIGAAIAGREGFVLNVEHAGHAFDNHESEMFWNEAAAKAAWAKTMAFLGLYLPRLSRPQPLSRTGPAGGRRWARPGPMCSYAAGMATRPRGVRASRPCWMRNGSYMSSTVSGCSPTLMASVLSPTGPPANCLQMAREDGAVDLVEAALVDPEHAAGPRGPWPR